MAGIRDNDENISDTYFLLTDDSIDLSGYETIFEDCMSHHGRLIGEKSRGKFSRPEGVVVFGKFEPDEEWNRIIREIMESSP